MKRQILSILLAGAAIHASAQEPAQSLVECGGDFDVFMEKFAEAAIAQDVPESAVKAVIASAKLREDVLKLDRTQHTFKQTFLEFSGRTVSQSRLDIGAQKLEKHSDIFEKISEAYGVSPAVITTFWAMETDFGAVQGNMNTVSALATLAHDCRRPELFQPQLLGAMQLTAREGMNPAETTGAWAGEIGMVQMLPADIIKLGVDADADGHVDLKTSVPDALHSAANMLRSHGWKADEPWIQEVKVEGDEAWQSSGLDQKLTVEEWASLGVTARTGDLPENTAQASLVAPQGRFGPVFLTYDNYDVFLEWNKSFIYSLSAAYMATRFAGAPAYDAGDPEAGLSVDETKSLQEKLAERGHEVGKVDGIIGAKTRAAVRSEQIRLELVPDGWPTPALLGEL